MIAAVILAAGQSERLGQPKQLLPYRGKTLLRSTVDCAIEAACSPVIVVLGARADLVQVTIEGVEVESVLNKKWREGLGTTIRAGIQALQKHDGFSDVSGVVLLNSDQPLLRSEVIRRMQKKFDEVPGRVVACQYADTTGTPALFEKTLIPRLLELPANSGAKPVIEHEAGMLRRHSWPEGALDIDTPDDYCALIEKTFTIPVARK